jgi:hypothetical protein
MMYKIKRDAGQSFTGVDVDTGRLTPGRLGQTGSPSIQVRLNSVRFATDVGSPVDFELFVEGPTDEANKVLLFGGTGYSLSDDSGRLLPTESDGASWDFLFSTTVLDHGRGFSTTEQVRDLSYG